MEKLSHNLHAKLQEMCDCYMETDFKSELAGMSVAQSSDLEEDAIKYLSLAIMYAITEQASKLSLKIKGDDVKVTVKSDEKETLSAPSSELAAKSIEIMRTILHLEEDKSELPLSLGLRSGQVDVLVKLKREGEKESMKIAFK